MVDININIEVIKLNVKELNIPIKRLRLSEGEKSIQGASVKIIVYPHYWIQVARKTFNYILEHVNSNISNWINLVTVAYENGHKTCIFTLVLLNPSSRSESIFSLLEFDHETCFGQWDIDKHDVSRALKRTMLWGLLSFCPWESCEQVWMSKPKLACWETGGRTENRCALRGNQPVLHETRNWLQVQEWGKVRTSEPGQTNSTMIYWAQDKLLTRRMIS